MAPIPPKSLDEIWNRYTSSYSATKSVPNVGKSGKIKDMPYYELKYNDTSKLTLKYTFDAYGVQPPSGYPLFIGLHGGGSGSPEGNDNAWHDMWRGNYGKNVKNDVKIGVYIAVRGITDGIQDP
ncbi:hypothetical protein AOQ84DRAFT_416221 [Glonium stellatum]|uniref:Uncharacterized protein n=1 Tax=Glonium stellatum TaxID=574774 RepID=A0A8E2JZV2_9PEZI|nr:hypothetical protein AOQ84DRAFT_416221 [Glonium stellatum]